MTTTAANLRANARRADAVRYRMSWRLVPSINHKLAGSMQPISMLASILARHLQRPQLDIPALSKQVADMQQACKTAITTRTEVMGWFQPSETELATIADEAAQCVWLLTAEFAIRGSSVKNLMSDATGVVLQSELRTMFMATLFAILDNVEGPVAVQLYTLPASGRGVTVIASWNPLASADTSNQSSGGKSIDWDDVQSVAEQLGVGLQRKATQIDLHFALAD